MMKTGRPPPGFHRKRDIPAQDDVIMWAMVSLSHGVYPVLYSLFDASGQLDRGLMRDQVEVCLEVGVTGIVVLGLASEVMKLDWSEQRMTIEWAASDVGGRVPLLATIGAGPVTEQLTRVAAAGELGADWVILQPPPDPSLSEEALVAHMAAVIQSSDVDVAIQYAPEFMESSLTVGTLQALVHRDERVRLIKGDINAADTPEIIERLGNVPLLVGKGGMELPDHLRGGAMGVIPAPECVDLLVAVVGATESGDMVDAGHCYRTALPAIVFTTQSLSAIHRYGKRLFVARAGLGAVYDRAPGQTVSSAGQQIVQRFASELGPLRPPGS